VVEEYDKANVFPGIFGVLVDPIVLHPIKKSGPELDPGQYEQIEIPPKE
jgi:hypothetical protein